MVALGSTGGASATSGVPSSRQKLSDVSVYVRLQLGQRFIFSTRSGQGFETPCQPNLIGRKMEEGKRPQRLLWTKSKAQSSKPSRHNRFTTAAAKLCACWIAGTAATAEYFNWFWCAPVKSCCSNWNPTPSAKLDQRTVGVLTTWTRDCPRRGCRCCTTWRT